MKLRNYVAALGAGASLLAVVLASQSAGSAPVETAKDIMKKACDAYAGHQSLTLKAIMSVDKYSDVYYKSQKNYVVEVNLKMPNKYKSNWQGDANGEVYFDGTKATVIDNNTNFYAQADMVGTVFDFVELTDKLNIPTPMLDLINPQNCKESLKKADTAKILSDLSINGSTYKHVILRNKSDKIYWEAWVKIEGDRYVIKKVIITSGYLKEQPQYEISVTSESLDVPIADEVFAFVPPLNALKIRFLETMNKKIPGKGK